MAKRKTELIRDKLIESARLRREMSEAGDEFVTSLRRIADRGSWKHRSASTGRYVRANTVGDITTGAIRSKRTSITIAPDTAEGVPTTSVKGFAPPRQRKGFASAATAKGSSRKKSKART